LASTVPYATPMASQAPSDNTQLALAAMFLNSFAGRR
jgi:hypothetical protein